MPRGIYVGLLKNNKEALTAVETMARWHITAVRRTVAGRITEVHHIQFGWIQVQTYYQLQKIHDFMPIIVQVIEGGYRLKAAIWSFEIPLDVLGSGIGIPMGAVLVLVATALAAIDWATGNQLYAWIDLAALALPFGELWLLIRGLDILYAFISGQVSNLVNFIGTTSSNPLFLILNGPLGAIFGGLELLNDTGVLGSLASLTTAGESLTSQEFTPHVIQPQGTTEPSSGPGGRHHHQKSP